MSVKTAETREYFKNIEKKKSFLWIIKNLMGGHRNSPKQQKCRFPPLPEPMRPISGATLLTTLDDLTLCMSHNFPLLLKWRKFSIFPE